MRQTSLWDGLFESYAGGREEQGRVSSHLLPQTKHKGRNTQILSAQVRAHYYCFLISIQVL